MVRLFSTNGKPVASASPSDWLAIPALPSCSAQTSGVASPAGGGAAGSELRGKATIGLGLRKPPAGGKHGSTARNKIARRDAHSYDYGRKRGAAMRRIRLDR